MWVTVLHLGAPGKSCRPQRTGKVRHSRSRNSGSEEVLWQAMAKLGKCTVLLGGAVTGQTISVHSQCMLPVLESPKMWPSEYTVTQTLGKAG